jgi:outer membrane protein assembly factor BamB
MIKLLSFAFACLVSTQLVAASWNQYRSNDLNNGFLPVQTSPAENLAWTLDVGPINGTCPVVGNDGTIYVANGRGVLHAIRPDGTLLWKRELRRGWRCSTPSVSSNGNIYVHCTLQAYVTDHRGDKPRRRYVQQSQVFCCNSAGGIRWTYTPPTVTLPNGDTSSFFFTSAPKVWEEDGTTHLFLVESYWSDYLMQRNFLIALNDSGEIEDARFLSEAAFAEITGGGGFSLKKSGSIGSIPLPATAFKPENAIGIVNFSDKSPVIIVSDVADCITSIEWRERGFSSILWRRPPSNAIFDYFVTSPSIHYGGLVIFGRSDGRIFLLDPWTGEELYKPWPKLNSGIYSTAASFLRQFYLITHDGDFITFDGDGGVLNTTPLGAQSYSSPAFSASHLYVTASNGIYTFNFDGEKVAFFEFEGGGNSSPAIGNDGFIYALGSNTLHAFSN